MSAIRTTNRVMIITGASRGIGAATAIMAGAEGYKVCVNYSTSEEAAESVVKEIVDAGGTAIAVKADISNEADVMRMFEIVDDKLGQVTALINNAGINYPTPFTELDLGRLRQIIAVNIEGSFIAAREALRRMIYSKGGLGGVIINSSSISARSGGGPHNVVYAASKGMIDTFTTGLAKEYARDGVRVCCLRPGMTDTDIFANIGGITEARKKARETVPMGRMAGPKEIAALSIWLCSDAASYVTGTYFDVTGGS